MINDNLDYRDGDEDGKTVCGMQMAMGVKLWRRSGMGKIHGNGAGTEKNSWKWDVDGDNLFYHVTL